MFRVLATILVVGFAVPAGAATYEISPGDDVRAAISALQPGDELVLTGGTYVFSSRFNITVVGESGNPIVIRAKDGEQALIEMNTRNQNILEVQGSRYLELRNLKFTGGSHGIRFMNSSSFVTIEGCEIYDTGDVAISANGGGTYEGLVIRGNHIHHTNGTGEGMYLGCNNDACRVKDSIIEWNYVHHTNGPTVVQGDGIELKEGSSGNIIRHNVIHDTNYPGILTYSTVGNGPQNIIEGNVIWNSNDFAIQSAADSIIRNNIVLGSVGLQPHQAGSPSNQKIVHNTIVARGNALEVRGVTGPVVIANNAVYSQSGTAIRLVSGDLGQVTVAGNVGSGGLSGKSGGYVEGNGIGTDFVDGHFNGTPPIDLFPADGSALIGAGSAAYVTQFDFNGKPRGGVADAGAYRYGAGGNPGWQIAPEFKAQSAAISAPNPPANLTVE
jgi:hypothetical protein